MSTAGTLINKKRSGFVRTPPNLAVLIGKNILALPEEEFTVYDPTSGTQNVTTGSYTVTCIRLATDPNTFSWQLGVDDGLQPAGGLNRVQSAAKRYRSESASPRQRRPLPPRQRIREIRMCPCRNGCTGLPSRGFRERGGA